MTSDEIQSAYIDIGQLLGLDKHRGYVVWWVDGATYIVPGEVPVLYRWLDDDGDAFRLAVDTKIQIMNEDDSEEGSAGAVIKWPNGSESVFGVSYSYGGKYAATRRVIVYAALYIVRNGYLHRKSREGYEQS